MNHCILVRQTPEEKYQTLAREYENFAYVVSHDLNAPLRHVKEFTRLLIGEQNRKLTDEEQQYICFLEKSLEKIDNIQTALLAFSRLNTRAGPIRDVDCTQMAANALYELNDVIETYYPSVECHPLPTIKADPQQIHRLFVSLIDNALKFHEDGCRKRKLIINAQDHDDHWMFKIEDNGIGMEEKNCEEVFAFFKRLHPHKYSGIGAGLAIAHKIVQRHGGEIFIESALGLGTKVFFTIPKQQLC